MDLGIGFYLALLIALSLLSSWLQKLGFLFVCKISKEKIPSFRSIFLIQTVSFLIISQIIAWEWLYKVYRLSPIINDLITSSIQILIVAFLTSYFMKIRPFDSIKSQIFSILISIFVVCFWSVIFDYHLRIHVCMCHF